MSDIQNWAMIVGTFSLMLTFIGLILRIFGRNMDIRFDAVKDLMAAGFESVDRRFEQVDRRFEQVDKRFEQVDKRFEQVDKRFEHVEKRLDRIEVRVDGLDRDVTLLTRQLLGPDAP
ncbi:hypothetical protein [Aeromicrobium sp. UC242_57]|uniref:hypothetical protein n=1 Tax=Aeromicrobium sp. UC242_57 TaxID=3374624 RepID=UPI0037BD988D